MRTLDRHDHAAEVRRALVDVAAVCAALGLERSKSEKGKWVCPRHGGGSLNVTVGPDRTLRAKCFGCDFGGDALSLVAECRGLDMRGDFPKVVLAAAELAGLWSVVEDIEGRARPVAERRAKPMAPRPMAVNVEPERTYPAAAELAALWAAAGFVADDAEAAAMLRGRGLDAELVDFWALARVLPTDAELPRWARYSGRSWTETGHRLLLPVYDAEGTMRSVRAWRVVDNDTPKRLPPSGHKAAGLVLADGFAVSLLRGLVLEPLRVLVVEGEPDFVTWATEFSDANADAPVVLGIGSGAWTDDLAARIPDGAEVIVRTHADEAGDKYAKTVARSLARRCRVVRAAA